MRGLSMDAAAELRAADGSGDGHVEAVGSDTAGRMGGDEKTVGEAIAECWPYACALVAHQQEATVAEVGRV